MNIKYFHIMLIEFYACYLQKILNEKPCYFCIVIKRRFHEHLKIFMYQKFPNSMHVIDKRYQIKNKYVMSYGIFISK